MRSIRGRACVYLHVPYCARLCLYCGCHTKIVRRRAPIDAYAELLAQEIDLVAARTKRQRVSSIHWGGGTPSMLGPERLIALNERITRRFDCTRATEHAIEIDPRQCDPALAQALAAIGVNRASLGVQEFAPHVQQAIGRVQPFETVAATVALLRAAGIASLNFDLMHGLPHRVAPEPARYDPARRYARPGPHRAVRLRACAVVEDAPAPDRRRGAAGRNRAARPGGARARHVAGARLCAGRARSFRAAAGQPRARRHGGAAAAQFPGLYHRRCRCADRHRGFRHRPPAARLRAERAGPRGLWPRDRGRRVRDWEGNCIERRRSAARRDHRTADVQSA